MPPGPAVENKARTGRDGKQWRIVSADFVGFNRSRVGGGDERGEGRYQNVSKNEKYTLTFMTSSDNERLLDSTPLLTKEQKMRSAKNF